MTLTERKVLEAACITARKTNAAIASHITAGPTALSVMDALEGFGCPLEQVPVHLGPLDADRRFGRSDAGRQPDWP